MKKAKEMRTRKCPYCGAEHEQVRAWLNRSGTQRCRCSYAYNKFGHMKQKNAVAVKQ